MKKAEKRILQKLENENLDRFAGSSDEEDEPMAPPAPIAAGNDDGSNENGYSDDNEDVVEVRIQPNVVSSCRMSSGRLGRFDGGCHGNGEEGGGERASLIEARPLFHEEWWDVASPYGDMRRRRLVPGVEDSPQEGR